ncbi:peptidoglycan binding domain-containing protein [Streptomyces sp. TLI_171]|uniref:peptidoglycan binding domain-containing protein n=1 Tax=Streptomyces sp. TLI_171 TaxID=1938859 RepID=UPI000C176110|nr:peptidoglycan binding domain-containing protein [Streptomyces sp. TLI_171]RKE20967.1 putative peptidoglycan binding protein [Streptomyces sp. TLI_171]
MSSRESDNAHPQPRRGGPDAYPSGTPPYGTGLPGGTGADPAAGRPAPGPRGDEAETPKTETTLTTRMRINIPGSRPIPPIVVQSKVKDEKPAEPTGPRHRGGAGDPVLGVMDAGARTASPPNLPPEWQEPAPKPSESESTGEWFKPRQKGRPEPAPAAAPAPAAPAPGGAPQAAPRPAPRPSGAPASPFGPDELSSRTGGHPLPQQQADPFRPAAAAQDPFEAPAPQDPFDSPAARDPFNAPGAQDPFDTPAAGRRPAPGGAPTAQRGPGGPFPGAAGPGQEPEDTQIGGFDPITGDEPRPGAGISDPPTTQLFGGPAAERGFDDPPTTQLFLNGPAQPGDPSPAAGRGYPNAGDRPRPAAEGAQAAAGGGRFADVPAAQPFPGGPRAATPKRPLAPETQQAIEEDVEPEPSGKKRGGRGKKLLVYAVTAVLFVGAAGYGAGLMMNQSDIPKGTTVLGTSIGGDSRDQAVTVLDGSVGKIGQQPLKLKIGDQSVSLDPASAGLTFDTTATVDALTKHSYNPVEVFGSLTGSGKAVAPTVRVDRAKLKAALDDLAAKSGGSLQEGFVRFTDAGAAEVVPGKGGQGLDSAAAADKVEQAYRDRAAGKPEAELALPTAEAQPKVGQDALQAAADTLGKQVLNGNVTVTAGGKQFNFGRNTAAKALTLAPDASGNVVLKWDLDALAGSIGTTFDKVKTTKAGKASPITAQDVADAIGQTIGKSGRDRTFKFPA